MGDKNQPLKKTRKEPHKQRLTQLFFYAICLIISLVCYHKGFTFTTTRCRFQLTEHILAFNVRSNKFEDDELANAGLQMIFSVAFLNVDH